MPTFRSGKPWCTFSNANANAGSGLNAIALAGGDGDGDIDLKPGDNTKVLISLAGLYLITWSIGRATVASSSGIIGGLTIDTQVLATSRTPATTGLVSIHGTRLLQAVIGTEISMQCQFSASASVAFDALATQLGVVRVGPVRWTG